MSWRYFLFSFLCLFFATSRCPAQEHALDCARNFAAAPADQLDLANCYARQRHWNEAQTAIESYRRNHPQSIPAAVLQAQILLELHLAADATDVIDRMLQLYPRSLPLLTFYAQLSERVGAPERAEQLYLECTRLAPSDLSAWLNLGDFYLQNNGVKAANAFRQALQLSPTSALAASGLAAALALSSDPTHAQLEFRKAIDLNRHAEHQDPQVDFRFAEFLRDQEKYSESIEYYSVAIRHRPAFLDAYTGRALSYMKLEKWDLAERDLQVCLQDESRRLPTLSLLLKIYQRQGDSAKAQSCAAEIERLSAADLALKNQGNQIADALRKAHLFTTQNQPAQAAELYTQLLAAHPEVNAAWLGLGVAHADLGQLDDAESDFRKFLASSPSSPSGHLDLGKVLLRKKLLPEARSEFRSARQLDPLLVDARLGIAATFIEDSNFPPAIAELQEAAALPGFNVQIHLMLAEAFYKNAQPRESLTQVDLVLRREPQNVQAQRMRAILTSQKR